MNALEFSKIVERKIGEMNDLVHRKMPVLVGRMAKSHFQDNFRRGGFVNNGLHPWKKSQRESGTGTKTKALYKTLLSSRNHLFSSIQYIPGDAQVMIENRVPYASMHNEGEIQYVSPHKRNRLAAMSIQGRKEIKIGGGNVRGFTRKIPKRQFIGESAELSKKIEDKLDSEVLKIIKG
nr:phage virion morphogenesis protein [uncultured Bacteroides sp.]